MREKLANGRLFKWLKGLYDHKIVSKIRNFTESSLYPVIVGALVLITYVLSLHVYVAIPLLVLAFSFTCLFNDDMRPAFVVALFAVFSQRYKYGFTDYLSVPAIIIYVIFGALLIFSLVYHLTVYKFVMHKRTMWKGLLVLSVAYLLGGLYTTYYSLSTIGFALSLGATMLGIYFLFSLTMRHREDNLVYFARLCAVLTVVIALQVADIYVRYYRPGIALDSVWKANFVVLGWGLSNFVAEMLATLLPAIFYLIYKEKRGYLYYLVVVLSYVAIYFTLGRNGLIWSTGVILVGMIVNCFKGKNRKINSIVALIVLLGIALMVVMLFVTGYAQKIFRFIIDTGISDRGRFDIWNRFMRLFKEGPLFGTGFSAFRQEFPWKNVYNAHNTIIQILSSTGIVGIFAYAYHRAQTVKLIVAKRSFDNAYVGMILAVGVFASLLDPLFFRVYFAIVYSATIMIMEKTQECTISPPLPDEKVQEESPSQTNE